ncbi:hypothetical protein [Glaciihabitans sp. dw_435]|uniref:hypothetical protein n=1 Tax=Glaciihabitans sp. dw_435 TaxID=2720081 RepID=UPI001BD1F88C|nr:hypothetical protein [Glaciihabitans sp. dw_435]
MTYTNTLSRQNVEFIVGGYALLATDPMFYSRARELAAIRSNAAEHGIFDISDADFDFALTERFGNGATYEFPTA